ncbi:MAG TPA: hypothetical protein VGD60_12500 [Candidatus Acidoferrales bacterium]
MRKSRFAFVLLTSLLCTGFPAFAQRTAPRSVVPATPSPDLSALNLEKILQQVQTTNVQTDGDEASFLQVVTDFLQLQPAQVSELEQLLQARQAALVPLLTKAQALTQQLGNLLNSGGNPAQAGALLIQIHALQQQMGQTQQAFVTQFALLLDQDQKNKVEAVQIAVQLQPVLPAFQPILLF